jgi:hypothetical protein
VTVFGFCDDGNHVRMLSEVRWEDSGGTKHGACASCIAERNPCREVTLADDLGPAYIDGQPTGRTLRERDGQA